MTKSPARTIPRVLVVDDDPDIPFFFRANAERYGFDIDFVYASDVGEAVTHLNGRCCDAAVIDVILKGVTGVSLGQEIRKHDPLIPLAYLTSLNDDEVRSMATQHHAQFLYKPRFYMVENGWQELLQIVDHLAHMNPCLTGGVRLDARGFERQLPSTPLKMAEPFMKLLTQSRQMARAAA